MKKSRTGRISQVLLRRVHAWNGLEVRDIQEVVFLHKETHEILAYPIADGPTDEEFDYINVRP